MGGKAQPTLRDVAREANLSVGTVSKYLNRPELVKEKNRKAIEDAIRRLQYTPNTLAQRLARGRSNAVMLYVVNERELTPSTWLHLLPLIQEMNASLAGTGYTLEIRIGAVDEPDRVFKEVEELIGSRTVDGLALLSAWEADPALLEMLREREFPFLLLENRSRYLRGREIFFDNRRMTRELVDELYRLGHRRIAFVGVEGRQQHIQDRLEGYRLGLAAHQLPEDPRLIAAGDFSIESGFAAMEHLLDLPEEVRPTAVIFGNDNMAAGALRAARNRGLSVPEDLSVCGIDDSIAAQATDPRLTTMALPMAEMGGLAIRELLHHMQDPAYRIPRTVLSCTLVPGGSIGPVHP